MNVPVEKVDTWIREVSERFADVTQFQNSEYYIEFAEWEEAAWEELEEFNDEVSNDIIYNEIFLSLLTILSNSRDEIQWTGAGQAPFNRHMDDLVYPDAWLLWNARRYDIQTDLFSGEVRERTLRYEDVFQ